MRKASFEFTLGPSERAQLEQWESAQGTPQQVALRCRIILMALAGEQNQTIAARLGVSPDRYMTLSYGRLFDLWREQHHSDVQHLTFEAVGQATGPC